LKQKQLRKLFPPPLAAEDEEAETPLVQA